MRESENEAEAGVEDEAAERTSNASELGRIALKSSLQRVVHFTGSGRFSKCAFFCRCGKAGLSRLISREQLLEDGMLRTRLLNAHWGGLAWEQVAPLQHLRVAWEAQQQSRTLFLVQAIDRAKGPTELTKEQSFAALQVANMNKTQYLMGICPLYEGMAARISCI